MKTCYFCGLVVYGDFAKLGWRGEPSGWDRDGKPLYYYIREQAHLECLEAARKLQLAGLGTRAKGAGA